MIVNPIKRRPTRKIRVGSVYVGGDAPISIQSMTNTETCDVAATVAQIQRCVDAGADIMRVSVPTMEAAAAFGEIRKQVNVPLVADIHFDYKIALAVADLGADCLRINPGNIGSEAKIREVVAAARHNDISMRIGVNAGSLEKDIQKKYGEPTGQALLESAMRHIDILDRLDFQEFKISVKASNVFLTMEAYRLLSQQIDNPLHLGVTEAGIYRTGSVKSAIALGGLLMEGIGDTMRISLAAEPEEEIKIGFDILKSLNNTRRIYTQKFGISPVITFDKGRFWQRFVFILLKSSQGFDRNVQLFRYIFQIALLIDTNLAQVLARTLNIS
jgi:(E)-4-hydroxy-3-methylbut-2-enyl-diphosphate synthase